MELDILNDIFSNTVGDLFSFSNKYNIISTAGNRLQNNVNGKNTSIKQQTSLSNENAGGQQQLKALLPNQYTNNQQVQQTKTQQQVIKHVGVNQSSNLDVNGMGQVGYENKKLVSMSLNTSIQNSLLDQSSNQLNTSKDSIQRGGLGGNGSLNTSFNSKNSQNVFSDSTNTLRSSQFVNNYIAGVHQSQQIHPSNTALNQINGQYINNFSNSVNSNNIAHLTQNLHQQNINNSSHPYQNNQNIQGNSQQQAISQQQGISQQQQLISQQYLQNNQHQQHMNNRMLPNQMKNHGVQNFVNNYTKPAETNKENIQLNPDEWIKQEAPQKLEESMKRLGLDNQKITQRMIKEMNYDQLQTEKKRVKNELKLYDLAFENYFKIEPSRNQKEPMRPLYVYYKGLKQALSKCQNENKQPSHPSSANVNPQNTQNGIKKPNQNVNVTQNSQTTSAQTSVQLTNNSYQNSHNNSFDIHNNFNTAQNYLNSNNIHQNSNNTHQNQHNNYQNYQFLNNPQQNNLFQNNQIQNNNNQQNIQKQNNQYQNILQQNNSLQNNSLSKQNASQNRNIITNSNSNTVNQKTLQVQNQQQRVNNTQLREPTRNNDLELNKNKELLLKNSYQDLLNISQDQKENYNNIQSHQQQLLQQQSSSLQLINNKQTNILSNNNTIKDQQNIKMIEQKINQMKRKRVALREQLQVYQDDFYHTHNRKIKYHKDILPVEDEYKEYKNIKKEIMKLEMMLQPQMIQQ